MPLRPLALIPCLALAASLQAQQASRWGLGAGYLYPSTGEGRVFLKPALALEGTWHRVTSGPVGGRVRVTYVAFDSAGEATRGFERGTRSSHGLLVGYDWIFSPEGPGLFTILGVGGTDLEVSQRMTHTTLGWTDSEDGHCFGPTATLGVGWRSGSLELELRYQHVYAEHLWGGSCANEQGRDLQHAHVACAVRARF